MKLTTKMCLWVTMLICFSLSLSGYVSISTAFEYSMSREQKQAVNQFQFVKFVLQSYLISEGSRWNLDNQYMVSILNNGMDMSQNHIAVFNEVKEKMNSTFPTDYPYGIADDLQEGKLRSEIKQYKEKYYLELSGAFHENDHVFYLLSATDVSSVIADRKQMEQVFYTTYAVVFTIGSILALMFSTIMMRPIRRLTKSTQTIAQGNYGERVYVTTKDEIGELSQYFNKMADEIEKNIEDLKLAVIQKENFVANFAHELKTPLTSVIGYSDMIYHKELTRKEMKEAAQYIMNEGLRLESLSLKLMDLVVLDKQEFVLEYLFAYDLFQNITETTVPIVQKNQSQLEVMLEPAYIKVEFDLFKTLILNLLDNALKASASKIEITGSFEGDKYAVSIADNGIGIPEEELNRIMEAFYVVDKSRSRAQHGAGLGLALVKKIAEIHGSSLTIESEVGKGTVVTIYLEGEVAEL